jgi:integrase
MIPGVVEINGHLYLRRRWLDADRKRHVAYVGLPAIDDLNFNAALTRAKSGREERAGPVPGTIAALAAEFRGAINKRKLAAATRLNYLRYVDRIEREHGTKTVKGMRPAHVYKIRDELEETVGVANNYLAVLRLMMAFACERDWRDTNPAAGVPKLPGGEHEPWPADVLEAALAAATPMMRLAIVTGLCGGQRIGDTIRLQHGWNKNGIIEVVQGKTRVFAAIPMHPLWLAEIDKVPRRALTILYDRSGQPFASVEPIQARIRDLMAKIGAHGFTFHGLRKNACCYLLEMGLNDVQVGSTLGMSAEMVRHYGKRARSLMIAKSLAEQLTGGNVLILPGLTESRVVAKNAGKAK